LNMVRKEREQSHAMRLVEGDIAAKRYLIVDDFLATGETIRAIVRAVHDFTNDEVKCIGVMLYYHINGGDPLVIDSLCVTGAYPDGALKFDPSALT